MKKRKTFLQMILFIKFVLILSGCIRNEIVTSPTEFSTADLIKDNATPISVLSSREVQEIVNDEGYLDGCKDTYSHPPNKQLGFKEIYPGISTTEDIIEKLGTPYEHNKLNNGQEDYVYSDQGILFANRFTIENNVVTDILIYENKELLSAEHVLKLYGCPNILIAFTYDDHSENRGFEGVGFWYLNGGLYVSFRKYPIRLSDVPETIVFKLPFTLDVFLDTFTFDKNTFTPIPFLSAVINQ